MFAMLKTIAFDLMAWITLFAISTLILRSVGPGPCTTLTPEEVCQNSTKFFSALDTTLRDFHTTMCKVPSAARGHFKRFVLDSSIDMSLIMQGMYYDGMSRSFQCLHEDIEVYLGTGSHARINATEFNKVVCNSDELMAAALLTATSINRHLADRVWLDKLFCVGDHDYKHHPAGANDLFDPNRTSQVFHISPPASSVVIEATGQPFDASSVLSLTPTTFDNIVCGNDDLLNYLQSTIPSFNMKNALIVEPIRGPIMKCSFTGLWIMWTFGCARIVLGLRRSTLAERLVALALLFLMYGGWMLS